MNQTFTFLRGSSCQRIPETTRGSTDLPSKLLNKALFVAFLLLSSFGVKAQLSSYSFSTGTGASLDPLTTPTDLITTGIDDGVTAVTPIGFNFTFNGSVFSDFSANTNGLMRLGTSQVTNTWTNAVASGAFNPKIMPYWDDHSTGNTGSIRTTLIGSAPNRIRVVEWFLAIPRSTTSPSNSRFQVWLYETSNVVEFRYGTGSNAGSATIGLSNATTMSGDYNVVTNSSTHVSSISTTAGTANNQTVWPGNGRRYTWTPPLVCSGAPTVGSITASSTLVCGGNTVNLSIPVVPGSGISYQWQFFDGVSWVNLTGQTGLSTTQTITATRQYRVNVTCASSGLSTASTPVTITQDNTCYCASAATSAADEDISQVTLGTFSNSSTCGAVAPGPGSVAGMYSNFTTLAPQVVSKGVAINVSVTTCDVENSSFYNRSVKIFIDGNQDGDYLDVGEEVFLQGTSSTPPSGTVTFTGSITIPAGFNSGLTGMRVICSEVTQATAVTSIVPCGNYGYGETEDYIIDLQTSTACAGAPAVATTLSSSPSVCASTDFTLSITPAYSATGITYQWQTSANAGGPWADVSGATNNTYTTQQSSSTYYRVVASCGANSTPSTPVLVSMNLPYNCNCVSAATNAGDEEIRGVQILGTTLNNSSVCSATAGPGSLPSLYSNYKTLPPTNLTLSQSYTIRVTLGSCGVGTTSYDSHAKAYLDLNQDGDFNDAGEEIFATTTPVPLANGQTSLVSGVFNIPCTAPLGTTTLRVIQQYVTTPANPITPCGNYGFGETEDYLVTIVSGTACSGSPAISTTLASPSTACPSTPISLSLNVAYASCDFSFVWERSTDGGGTWSVIPGQTQSVATVTGQTVTTLYRCLITCANSGLTTTSNSVNVGMSPIAACFCSAAPVGDGFLGDGTEDEDITRVILNTIDQSSSSCVGIIGATYTDFTSVSTTLTKSVVYPMSVEIGTCGSSYTGVVQVWIDFNRDGDFDLPGEAVYNPNGSITAAFPYPATNTFPVTVPLSATDGPALMRIIFQETYESNGYLPCGNYGWGETEDYIVNIVSPPACSGSPVAGTLPTTLSVFNNASQVLQPVGLGLATGLLYEWQESDDNGVGDAWAPVVGGSGASSSIYTTPNLSSTIWYRLRVECTNGNQVTFTNATQINVIGGTSCADPYLVTALPFSLNVSSVGAGNDIGTQTSLCSSLYGGGQDVVFQFTAPGSGNYEISVVNTSNTRSIGWFLKDNLNCNTTSSSLACAVSTAAYNSAHDIVSLTGGSTYFVVVDYATPVTASNFFIRIRQVPAAPGNDNCATSTLLTQSGTCTPVAGTLAGATSSGVPVQCSGGNADDDVWYRFVASSEAALVEVNTTSSGVVESGANIAWELFSGSCGSLNPLACRNATASRGVGENGTLTGLTVGQTYYIRVYDVNSGYGSALGNITICVSTPPPPANDDCVGATVLAVGPSCVTTAGNTVAATQSLLATACNGFTGNADDDVWYTFTIAASQPISIEVAAANNTMDPVVQLYSGSCGSPVALDCSDKSLAGGVERINRTLGAGVYFVRVFHYGTGTGAGGNHTICVRNVFPPIEPTNDNTCTATVLTIGTECSPEGPFSSQPATLTLNQTVASQGDGNPSDDVWFRFTTLGGQTTVTIAVQGGNGYDPVWQAFAMSNCKTITGFFLPVDNTATNGFETATLFGLTPLTTYYVRVFDWFTANPSGNFTICVNETPVPPNDKEINAQVLFQQNSATCFSQTPGYTVGASLGDAVAPGGACGGLADDNVWYSFVATNTTATITVTGSQGFDPILNLRTGSPFNGTTSIACANSTGANGTETINATGLTIGATYKIMVYSAGTNPVGWGTFDICVYGPPAPPVNDNCAGAVFLPNASPCLPVNGILTGATTSLPPNCAPGSGAFDVWYSFIASSPQATLTTVGAQTATNTVVEMYGGSCGTLSSLGCINSNPAPNVENLVVNGLTPGQTYYARVYVTGTTPPGSIGGVDPNFSICFTGVPPGNDNIGGATLINVASNRVDINTNNLGATGSPLSPGAYFTDWNNDVWFRSIVPSNGVVAINVLPIGFSDTRLRVFTSSDNTPTGTLTNIAWDDDSGAGFGSFAYLSGLTPGTTLFYAVDGFSATNFGQFRLNVNDGWLWTGANGFGYNTIGNWIHQSASDGSSPNPFVTVTSGGSTGWGVNVGNSIINIPTVTNQPIVTANASIGGVKFVSGVFTQSRITVNSGVTLTLNGTTFAGTGRGITGISAGGRFEGTGRLDIGAAVSGQTVLVNYPTRFRLAVTALGTANVQSNGNMIFDNGASLYSGQAPPNSQVTGNITYRRQGNVSQYVYNFWSSPISNGVLASLAAPGYIPNLYQYNTPTATGLDYLGSQAGWQALTPATPMVPGKGYIATGAGLANFTGLPNQNQPIGPALQNGAGNVNNFNLVGNPYPAPVSAAQFITGNPGAITGSIYIWDDDASAGLNYAAGDFIVTNGIGTVNGPNSGAPFSGNIGACQGFFVEKLPAFSGNIVFNHSMKVYGTNSEFFNVEDASRLRLRMENSNGVGTETLLAFTADATDGVDPMYDATRLQGNATLSLYTFNGTGEYVIQAWPTLATERIFPLGTVNTVSGPSSITVNQFENFDPSTVVYLEDVANGVFHNLTENPTYNFNNTGLNTGVNGEEVRFKLHFRAPIAVASSMDCSGMEMGKIIVANPNTTPVALEVVNENNAVIATAAAFVGEHEVSGLAAGAYTLNLSYADGASTSKTAVVESNGMTSPATFIASATTVSIADAIIEFQGTAQGATQYIWNFGDGSAEVTGDINPVHAYNAPGVYTVTFTALNNGCGSTATTTITVTNDATGIGSAATANGFTIFPNPASEVANLLLNVDRSTTDVTISIHDAAGRLVSTQQVNEVRSGAMIALPIEALSNGVYQVTVEGKSFRNTGRLTIAK